MELPIFTFIIQVFSLGFGIIGAAIIIGSGLVSTVNIFLLELHRKEITYAQIRRFFTDKIVFGLDFFIAGDVLTTVTNPTQEELITLGAVVVIRTIMGYFISVETRELDAVIKK
jgi:uncharacterized membrane protein